MSNRSRPLVLFDIDGTLIRRAGGHHKEALVEGIRRVTGLETHLNGVATSGMLDRDLIIAMLQAAGANQKFIQASLNDIVFETQKAYLGSCAVDMRPNVCGGVLEFIVDVKHRGAVLGLVTGNLSQIGWRKLELAGLREYFSLGAFAEDGHTRERLARIAVQRARELRLIGRNAPISLIGDHMNDVAAARANGYRSIAVATGVTPRDELKAAEPDILVSDLSELDRDVVFNPKTG
jgi:phosphoglycolate phosphatase-like HAD superfamily hydrolase